MSTFIRSMSFQVHELEGPPWLQSSPREWTGQRHRAHRHEGHRVRADPKRRPHLQAHGQPLGGGRCHHLGLRDHKLRGEPFRG